MAIPGISSCIENDKNLYMIDFSFIETIYQDLLFLCVRSKPLASTFNSTRPGPVRKFFIDERFED